MTYLRLGLNIDHIATVRNARGGGVPDPIRAAKMAATWGVDGITAHLREDRRHIKDQDIERLISEVNIPLNLEIAATEEMLAIALRHKPHAVCLVPEKREELTTEGGLDVYQNFNTLLPFINKLSAANIRVSLFIDPDEHQVRASKQIGAPVVELHTGRYCDSTKDTRLKELNRIKNAAILANSIGLECHAGHGLTISNVEPIAEIQSISELNIGHFLVGEAIFFGLEQVIADMRAVINQARPSEAA